MTAANVVDVSEWQPTSIDWANLKANGVKAVVVRIGHGVTRDEHAADHIANATKAGLIVHVYHYYEGVDGELQYSVNNAKSLNIQPNVYYFLDMEGTIAGSWPSIFDSFRNQWSAYGWNTGLYCSLSNYAKFDDATLVKQGVYRWIAAWGSNQPSNADMWQYDSKTGLGSYTSALDKDIDIAGKLIETPDSTVVEPTDPNGNYTIKPGAFVGFDHSTTELQGGEMLVASPDGHNKIPKLSPDGQFLFNNNDGDNMWALIKPKIDTIEGEKGDKGDAGAISDTSTDFNNLTSEGHYDIRFSPNTGKNGPNEGNWGLLDVKVAGRMVVQTYYGDANANVYVRNRRDGSTWTAWRSVTF
ncbi:GH25 family lysozyme [Limosilactobacillus fermentum]|uniref:GH25 family lysozyme n=1 Tax=Limosilactobacillus fermentum TaxID=1613 RepID=UPI00285EC185|nr:GH25 family lysozyme [Limosilactobacillus fermentum]MDR7663606.1 GH25 family lysozyme [Limosilactobacillus fermentum]MDR7663656.1 GH25 family lysozyme [Limosilactobacillus fermentum]